MWGKDTREHVRHVSYGPGQEFHTVFPLGSPRWGYKEAQFSLQPSEIPLQEIHSARRVNAVHCMTTLRAKCSHSAGNTGRHSSPKGYRDAASSETETEWAKQDPERTSQEAPLHREAPALTAPSPQS